MDFNTAILHQTSSGVELFLDNDYAGTFHPAMFRKAKPGKGDFILNLPFATRHGLDSFRQSFPAPSGVKTVAMNLRRFLLDNFRITVRKIESGYALRSERSSGHGSACRLKHGSDPDDRFDAEQLRQGIEVEMEHTKDKSITKQIAKAHLSEFPDYYIKLKKMEERMKSERTRRKIR